MNNQVILVDETDRELGKAEKLEAHKRGQLHRAFSMFVFNNKGELMLQQRAKSKYHSGGLWTNTCCSHPQPGHDLNADAHERLNFEMGFDCELKEIFSFVYKGELGELTEYEFDHVFIGSYNGEAHPNPEEADAWKWIKIEELQKDIENNPERYTVWFKIALPRIIKELNRK